MIEQGISLCRVILTVPVLRVDPGLTLRKVALVSQSATRIAKVEFTSHKYQVSS